MMVRVLLFLLLLIPVELSAETIQGNRVIMDFAFDASQPELEAAEKASPAAFAKAKAAGRPVRLSVSRSEGTTLISLESVVLCTRDKGCPLLVFRDLGQAPVLETFSFQNVVVDYRETGIVLVIRVWDKVRECPLRGLARAKCKELAAKRQPPS